MKDESGHLDSLNEIRTMMERSSRFISLSGLSGVFAGIFAIAGIIIAYYYLGLDSLTLNENLSQKELSFLIVDASVVLIASIVVASLLTIRKARKREQQIWNSTSKRLLLNMMIPLLAGGLFCIALLNYGLIGLIAPATLIFYGLALLNAGKYTLDDIRYLGICQLTLGIIATFNIGNGILYWVTGFGILHIVYGIVMYNKYER
jgi:hypothetical protein